MVPKMRPHPLLPASQLRGAWAWRGWRGSAPHCRRSPCRRAGDVGLSAARRKRSERCPHPPCAHPAVPLPGCRVPPPLLRLRSAPLRAAVLHPGPGWGAVWRWGPAGCCTKAEKGSNAQRRRRLHFASTVELSAWCSWDAPAAPRPIVPSCPAAVTAQPPPSQPHFCPPGPAHAASSLAPKAQSRLWGGAPPEVQHSCPAPPAEPGKASGEDRPALAGFFSPRQVLVAGKSLKPSCQQAGPVLEQLHLLPPLHPPSTINKTSPCAMHELSPFTPNYQPRSLCPPPSSPPVAESRKDHPSPPVPKAPLGACSPSPNAPGWVSSSGLPV